MKCQNLTEKCRFPGVYFKTIEILRKLVLDKKS